MKTPSESVEKRVAKLRTLINDYRYHYHVLDKSIMSEAAADSLKHELAELESQHPELITPDSPTQRVAGVALDKFTKVTHKFPMISLNDVFDQAEIEAWIKRTDKLAPGHHPEYFVDIKMDGLACSLIYEDGVLVRGVTRGNGQVGEDVTTNIRTIENIPLRLRESSKHDQFFKGRTEVRGEIVMYKTDFAALNEQRAKENRPLFANPRNLAAGTIRQLDPKLVAARPLHFHAYDLLRDKPDEVPTNSYAYEALQALGITTNAYTTVLTTVAQLMDYIETWNTQRETLKFNTDGLVIKLNDRKLFSRLGVVGKAPRGAVAYKYAAEEATTVVKDIVISIGRTGAATPIAVFDPVVVAGTTVQHASLHNADEIARKDVRVGDTVVVFKAGDIIPQVQTVLTELRPKGTKPFDYEAELKRQYPELKFVRPAGEAVYRVKGSSGPLILKRALQHYASKGALDIDTLGEKNVEALVDAGLVKDVADIYTLDVDQVIQLERFAQLSATNLVTAIQNAKTPPLERFIYALGIRHVGQQTAIDLAEHFGSLEKLAKASLETLFNIEGIGEVVAESIVAWFSDQDNQKLLAKFKQLGIQPIYQPKAHGPLHGKSFVITGTLPTMSRDEAADKIRELGGTFQTSVGKGTTYLVAGGKVGESKLKKAQKYDTLVIDEVKLMDLFKNK